jgi:hypothetical protein
VIPTKGSSVPPPPEPDMVWLHGKPSCSIGAVLFVWFVVFLAVVISSFAYLFLKGPH